MATDWKIILQQASIFCLAQALSGPLRSHIGQQRNVWSLRRVDAFHFVVTSTEKSFTLSWQPNVAFSAASYVAYIRCVVAQLVCRHTRLICEKVRFADVVAVTLYLKRFGSVNYTVCSEAGVGNLRVQSCKRRSSAFEVSLWIWQKLEFKFAFDWLLLESGWIQFSLWPNEVAWKIKRYQRIVPPHRSYLLESKAEWLLLKSCRLLV